MKSLFNETDAGDIISRINKLTEHSIPGWGKMNVAEMLAHNTQAIKVPLGELTTKRSVMGKLFGSLAKKGAMGDKPFGRGIPTSEAYIVKETLSFEDEKKRLIDIINKFKEAGVTGISKGPHPFFGNLTPQEWDILIWKHLDHHLTQFGI